jgi:hypothetical protein
MVVVGRRQPAVRRALGEVGALDEIQIVVLLRHEAVVEVEAVEGVHALQSVQEALTQLFFVTEGLKDSGCG